MGAAMDPRASNFDDLEMLRSRTSTPAYLTASPTMLPMPIMVYIASDLLVPLASLLFDALLTDIPTWLLGTSSYAAICF
jgi:hypothetical protein